MQPKDKKQKLAQTIPKYIGPYPIIKRIAIGGMGETFLAKDPKLGREIVIKRARCDLIHHEIIKKRFCKEANITSRLFHPSIIPVYSIHNEDNQLYYTMPYVEGRTLKQILRDSISEEKKGAPPPFSITTLLRIFQNVCHGVSYCHENGFLHRDLKPENILVGHFGQVYIVDWGLATHVHDEEEGPIPSILTFSMNQNLTCPGKIFGTLPYLPPERIKGKKASITSEVYSLGVILYQLLTLRMPFYRRTIEEYKLSKKYQRPLDLLEAAPFRNISEELSDIVKKCLHDNPQKRFCSVKELITSIEECQAGNPSWIHKKTLDLLNKEDWSIQENILSSNLSSFGFGHKSLSWKYLMISKETFFGNQKLCCSISIKEKSKGISICFNIPEKEDRKNLEDGYSLHLGSKNNPGVFLKRSKVILFEDTKIFLKENTKNEIKIIKKDHLISLFINEKKVFIYEDFLPMMGSLVGFSSEDMEFSLDTIEIFITANSKKTNCLVIPNTLLNSKHFKEAIEEYEKIALSFKGESESHEAAFKSGIATIYLAKQKRWTMSKNTLFDKAFTIFGTLENIASGPLALLGKSLIYKEQNNLEEECKCLEFAMLRYKNHPLIHLIEKQIHKRLHECAHQLNNRYGVYIFSLFILSYCPYFLDFKETHTLILDLPISHKMSYFLSSPAAKKSLSHLYKEMVVSLNFHLGRAKQLEHMYEQTKYTLFKDQIIFSLLYLAKRKKHFPPASKLLKQIPEKSYIKHFWPLFLKIEQNLIKKDKTNLFIIEEIRKKNTSVEIEEILSIYEIEYALLIKDLEFLEKAFKKEVLFNKENPKFFLYGCYLKMTKRDEEFKDHFSSCFNNIYPPASSIAALYILGKVSLDKSYLSNMLTFEKITLYKNLFIYYTCIGKTAKAEYYIHKTLSISPWKS